MKRCPTCNQTYEDEWLTFCTIDGTPLIDTGSLSQAPTVVVSEPVEARENMGEQPSAAIAPADYQSPPQSIPSTWQSPPPPRMVAGPSQSLAVWSMVLGLVSITLGWCCSFGLITAPVAIVLGIYALSQIKGQPNRYAGKPLAIAGIVSGGLYFVLLAVIVLIYGLGILLSGLNKL
ncbi:MAG: DUF4190 domain-containing protein [Blastocatellia bacterium]|nr:DUF4190 domain-containing protein [Blastocatellia bacterium]